MSKTPTTVKAAAAGQPKAKHPTVAAGGGSIAMALAAYLGHKFWADDPELTMIVASAIGVLMTVAVHYLHQNFPVLIDAIEEATGRDLDRDGRIGESEE